MCGTMASTSGSDFFDLRKRDVLFYDPTVIPHESVVVRAVKLPA